MKSKREQEWPAPSQLGHEMDSKEDGLSQISRGATGWSAAHRRYACKDGTKVEVSCGAAHVRGVDETTALPAAGSDTRFMTRRDYSR